MKTTRGHKNWYVLYFKFSIQYLFIEMIFWCHLNCISFPINVQLITRVRCVGGWWVVESDFSVSLCPCLRSWHMTQWHLPLNFSSPSQAAVSEPLVCRCEEKARENISKQCNSASRLEFRHCRVYTVYRCHCLYCKTCTYSNLLLLVKLLSILKIHMYTCLNLF